MNEMRRVGRTYSFLRKDNKLEWKRLVSKKPVRWSAILAVTELTDQPPEKYLKIDESHVCRLCEGSGYFPTPPEFCRKCKGSGRREEIPPLRPRVSEPYQGINIFRPR